MIAKSPGFAAIVFFAAALAVLGVRSATGHAAEAPFAVAPLQSLRLVDDAALAQRLDAIVAKLDLAGEFPTEDGPESISLAVVDLNRNPPAIAGVGADNFIYPASVYKMYVAAEVLRQIETGDLRLDSPEVVKPHNAVDRSKEVATDPRPLLAGGDTVTVGYLLDLMITRSDNSAANCLIDLASRPKINATLHAYGWRGSDVTRKFLKRTAEDPGYADVAGTETSARHAAEFLARIRLRTLVSPWVSMQLESLLGRQLDETKLARGLPPGAMFCHKTGWYAEWTHDVGIVDDGSKAYVVACFLPLPEKQGTEKLRQLGHEIHAMLTADRDDALK